MHLDVDRALDAISEIEDPEVRKGPVRQLLFMVESDEEAIRLGRDYGFDRDAVLELRENRKRNVRIGLFRISFPQHSRLWSPARTLMKREVTVEHDCGDPMKRSELM